MQSLAFKAYGEATQRTASGRSLELAVFEQITQELQKVHENKGADPAEWADAIQRNMQLWTIIATDVLSDGNKLPAETRKGLFALSEYVRRASMQVLSGKAGLGDIIEINRSIIAGLNGESTQPEQEVI